MVEKQTAPPIEPSRPLAILFTDIVGSSEYFARQGDAAGMALISRHNALLMPVVQAAGGRVVKTIGDSILATFEDIGQAVRAAWAMQQTLAKANESASQDKKIAIRIGVHYGLVFEPSGDVLGDAVNMAERVKSKADSGQILVSRVVRDLLRADPAIQLRSVGLSDLKGSPEPIELYKLTSAPAPGRATPSERRSFAWVYALGAVILLGALYLGWRAIRARSPVIAPEASRPQALATVSLFHWTTEGVRDEVAPQTATFSSGETFQIQYRTIRAHFLYAALFDAQKQGFILVFPGRDTVEPLGPSETVPIPEEGRIRLDNHPRTESILLILSTQPIEALENVALSGKTDDPSLSGILHQIKNRASTQAWLQPDRASGMHVEAALDSRPAWLDLEIDHR